MTATSPSAIALQNILQYRWHRATWADYVALRDDESPERMKLAFNEGWLWVTMGAEGISHATVSDLFTSLLFIWAMQHGWVSKWPIWPRARHFPKVMNNAARPLA